MIRINSRICFLLSLLLFAYASSASEIYTEDDKIIQDAEYDSRFELVKKYFSETEQANKVLFDQQKYTAVTSVYDLRNLYNQDPFISEDYTATLNEVVGQYYSQLASTDNFKNVQIRVVFDMYVTEDTVTRSNQISFTKDYCKGYIKRLLNASTVGKEFIVLYFGTAITKSNKQYPIIFPVISSQLQNKLSAENKAAFTAFSNALLEKVNTHNQEKEILLVDASSSNEYNETSLTYNSSDVSDAFLGIEEVLDIDNVANEYISTYSLVSNGVVVKSTQVRKALGVKYVFRINAQKQYCIQGRTPVDERYYEFFEFSTTDQNIENQFDNLAILVSGRFLKQYATVLYPSDPGPTVFNVAYSNPIIDYRDILKQPVAQRKYTFPTINFFPVSSSTLNSGQCILSPYPLVEINSCFALVEANESLCVGCVINLSNPNVNPCSIAVNENSRHEIILIDNLIRFIDEDTKKGFAEWLSFHGAFYTLRDYASRITTQQLFTCLTVDDRIKIITYVKNVSHERKASLDEREQQFLIKLVQYFPNDIAQKKSFLTKLKKDGLLEFLIDKEPYIVLDGQNLIDFSECLEKNFIRTIYPAVLTNSDPGKIFYYSPDIFAASEIFKSPDVIDIDENGDVLFGSRINFTWIINTKNFDPYASFTLSFINNDFVFGGQTFKKDTKFTASALYIFTILRFAVTERNARGNSLVINTALVASGIGGFTSAVTWTGRIVAGVDLAVGVVGIGMDNGWREELEESGYGGVVTFYDVVAIGWTAATLTPAIYKKAKDAIALIKKARAAKKFTSKSQQLAQIESEAERAVREFDENLALVKSGQNYKDILTSLKNNTTLKDHIFIGDYKKVTGCHFYGAVDNVNVRFVDGVTPSANSLGVIKGDIEMRRPIFDRGNIVDYRWTKKNTGEDPQTFFPSNWSKDEILEQCAYAISNPKKQLVPGKTRLWEGESYSGIFIRWYEDADGSIPSIFPEF